MDSAKTRFFPYEHSFCPCKQKLNFFTVRCTYRKPQRGDEIFKHLIEGQCFMAMRFLSVRPKVNASWR
jgi:hypothetical protein